MRFFLFLLVTMFVTPLFAGTPYIPEIDKRFNTDEANIKALQALPANLSDTVTGIGNLRVARVSFNGATVGNSSSYTLPLGVTLPAGAIMYDGMVYVTSGFTNALQGSIAIGCGLTTNILNTTNATVTLGVTGVSVATGPTGIFSAAKPVGSSSCAINATISGAAVVGKLDAWVTYFTSF